MGRQLFSHNGPLGVGELPIWLELHDTVAVEEKEITGGSMLAAKVPAVGGVGAPGGGVLRLPAPVDRELVGADVAHQVGIFQVVLDDRVPQPGAADVRDGVAQRDLRLADDLPAVQTGEKICPGLYQVP